MSSISYVQQRTSIPYTSSISQTDETQSIKHKGRHRNNDNSQFQDSVQISQQGLQALQGMQQTYQSSGNYDKISTASKTHVNPLDSLVKSGTITQQQALAVDNAFKTAGPPNSQQGTNATNPLESLVNKGTLTQQQATAIDDSFKMSGSSQHTRGAERKNPLNNLVTAGTITQDQATAIDNAFKMAGPPLNQQSTDATNPLDDLVKAGTITQEQQAAIMNMFQSRMQFNTVQQ